MSKENKRISDKDRRLQQWLNRNKQTKSTDSSIEGLPEGVPAPLSYGQQRLWFLQQLYPNNPFYHYAEVYRFIGSLRTDDLINSFKQVAQQHQILRTTFELIDSQAVQRVDTELHLDITTFDLQDSSGKVQDKEVEAIARAEAARAFDLQHGPLARISIIKLTDDLHVVILTMHHIIIDKWSMDLFRKEWAKAYQGKALSTLPSLQYADYAWWQRNQKIDSRHLTYWREKLSGELSHLTLPLDHQRPALPSFRGALCKQTFSANLSKQLQELCKQADTTMFVMLLSVYKVLLYRYSGQQDLVVGTPVTNRDQTSFENLIGFFNETVVLRTDISGNLPFIDWIGQVRSTVLEAFSHKKVPFESLVQDLKPERYLSTNPLFQVMFLYHNVPSTPPFGPDLRLEYEPFDLGISKFDLTLYISEDKEDISATFEFATDLFDQNTIERMQGHLCSLLEEIVRNPQQNIDDLPMLTKAERQQIVFEWNDTDSPTAGEAGIHKLIEVQALNNPDQSAVIFQGQSLTYKDLNNRANEISANLQATATSPGRRIGLCADRSLELIIGMLGILKAGHAYVPLDAEHPMERMQYIVRDAEMPVVLTQEHLSDLFVENEVTILTLDATTLLPSETESTSSFPSLGSDTAYVMYTSGSTGQPKGVIVSHQNLLHATTARFLQYSKQPGVFLLLSSFAFDSSVAGIFWSLCSGGTLVLCERRIEQDLDQLAEIIAQQNVTHTLLLPSLYTLLLQYAAPQKLASLNTVIVAGEACSTEVCNRHFETLPGVDLFNEYGPTEATVWSSVHQIQSEDTSGMVPIGKPIANTQHYILDTNLQPVPIGVIGELYIGGAGVTQGYLNQPELTKLRFVRNPFNNDRNSRLYKTGDLGRYNREGIIEFLGRMDNQIKIRGYRIEPEGIQEVLQRCSGVRETAVVAQNVNKSDSKEPDYADTDRLEEMLNHLDSEIAEHLLRSVELSTIPPKDQLENQ